MSGVAQPAAIYRDHWETDDLRYICGMANAGGGTMIITQDGKGSSGGFKRMKRPFEQIPRLTEKELGIICSTEPVLEGAKLCLEVTIPAAETPISYNGVYWYLDGEDLIKKDRQSIRDIRTKEEESSWEARPQPRASESDLNASGYLAITSMELDDGSTPNDSMEEVMTKRLTYLNLKRPSDNALTNAGVLLLHNKPESFIPGASIRLALFDKEHGEIVQHTEICGPLSRQFTEAMRLLYTTYLPEVLISGEARRQAPPEEAVKEAIRNALIHKDYESTIPVRISVYPDKLIIQNSAAPMSDPDTPLLPSSNTPNPRNPIIANTLRLAGRIHGWGGSLMRMIRQCEDAGAEPPIIEEEPNQVIVTFPFTIIGGTEATTDSASEPVVIESETGEKKPKHASPSSSISSDSLYEDPVDQASAEAANSAAGAQNASAETQFASMAAGESSHGMNMSSLSTATPKNAPFAVRSIAAANRLDLTATDEYVLRVLHTNGRATATRIANVLGVSESTVRRSFRKLKEHGFIERIGSDKAGYWRVIV